MYAQRTSLKYSPTSVRRACALIQVSRSALEEIAGRNRGYGQKLKALTVIDEWTRDCLAIEVASSLKATRVIAVLERLFETHGAPAVLRSDNGPEFIASALRILVLLNHSDTATIEPGKPWQWSGSKRTDTGSGDRPDEPNWDRGSLPIAVQARKGDRPTKSISKSRALRDQ